MPVPMLSPEELRTFVACADAGSFSAAAGRVHRTQSTVSGQIARIEQSVGAPVFARSARGVALTARGELLLGYARRLLALHDELADALGAAQPRGRLRLGLSEYVVPSRVADLLGRLARRFPELQLQTHVGQTARLQRMLAADELDLVVGTTVGAVTRGAGPVGVEPLGWVARERVRFARGAEVPLVLLDASCGIHQHALGRLSGAGLKPRIAVVASGVLGVHAAVAAGLGVGCLNRDATPAGLVRLGPASGLPAAGRLRVFTARRPGARNERSVALVAQALRSGF